MLGIMTISSRFVLLCVLAVFISLGPATARGFAVLYTFKGLKSGDGRGPNGGLIADRAGNLYGTTSGGGKFLCSGSGMGGCGTIFELSPPGSLGAPWTERALYSFKGGLKYGDGQDPNGRLLADGAGNLYGTTSTGGSSFGGTVFKLAADGTETVLYEFCGQVSCGQGPNGGLVADSAGNLYGTTVSGGTNCHFDGGCGTVFKVTPDGIGSTL